MGEFIGAVCDKHPHLGGARYVIQNGGSVCVGCKGELTYAKRNRDKLLAFEAYGGCMCAGCGVTDPDILTIDHIGGGGSEQRKELSSGKRAGGTGYKMYAWLRRNEYPKGYRVLCFNCNVKDHITRSRGVSKMRAVKK